jgi:hypothetical protein
MKNLFSILSRRSMLVLSVLTLAGVLEAREPIEKPGPAFNSPVLDATLESTGFLPPGTEDDAEMSIAVYAYNGKWDSAEAPSPEAMRAYLLDLGLGVVMLDYQQHPKAVKPDLWRDGDALMHKKFFQACNRALRVETREIFVVPEGYRLRKDVPFYTSPENEKEVSAWVLHPIQPEKPVPLAIRYNGSGSWGGGMLAELEFRGFARAWIQHPFNFDRGKGLFPSGRNTHEKGLAFGRSAVRTLRSRAAEFHLDPERFVLFGKSKHGNMSVWVGVQSGEPSEDPKWGGRHHDQSSAVQCVVAAATWGFSEYWQEDGAPKFHEWMGYTGSGEPPREWLLERSWTRYLTKDTPPMAIGRAHGGAWREAQVTRLIRALDDLDVPFMQWMDKKLPGYGSDRGDALHRFVENRFGLGE